MASVFWQWLRFGPSATNRRPATRKRKLGFEALEERDVPALTATLVTPPSPVNLANAAGNVSFTILYTPDAGTFVVGGSIDATDVSIVNGGTSLAALPGPILSQNGSLVSATYSVAPPAGSWATTTQGVFQVSVVGGTVSEAVTLPIIGTVVVGTVASAPNITSFNVDTVIPTASFGTPPNIVGAQATATFTVTYADAAPGAIDAATFGTGNVSVTNGGTTLTVTNASPAGNVVTYTIQAPAATWNQSPGGTYTIAEIANSVKDQVGNSVAAGAIGTFIVTPDTTPPTGTLTTPPTIVGSQSTATLKITYADNPGGSGVNPATFGTGNITVSGPASATVTAFSAAGNVVTYTISSPGATWFTSPGGTYNIAIVAGGVKDLAGNPIAAAAAGTFTIIADTTPPTGSLTSPPAIVGANSTATFAITYADNPGGSGVDPATFGAGNVTVMNGGTAAVVTGASPSGNTVTYTIAAPGGTWFTSPGGTYTIAFAPGGVKDLAANAIAAGNAGTFTVVPDTTPPTATLTITPIIVGTASTATFTVTYNDGPGGSGLDPTSIGPGNVTVSNGTTTLTVSGSPVIAGNQVTYTIQAPKGVWINGPGGTYTINLNAGGVKDKAANGVAAAVLGTFMVVADTTPPTAFLASSNNINIPLGGTTTNFFSVTYTDEAGGSGIDPTTFNPTNVKVINGALTLPVSSITVSGNTVTYNVNAPGGTWNNSPQGDYILQMVGNSVRDKAGNAVAAGNLGVFTVGTIAPTGFLTSPPTNVNFANYNNTSLATGRNSFTVTYTSLGAPISPASFGVNNVSTSPNLIITSATAVGNAVTYTVLSPLGEWINNPQGTYFINLGGSSPVKDTVGNSLVPVGNFAFFTVDTNPPTATLSTPPQNINAGNAAAGTNTFSITYADPAGGLGLDPATFGIGNVQVVNGATTLTVTTASVAGNVVTYTVLAPTPSWAGAPQGAYTIKLVGDNVKDLAGNGIVANPNLGFFTVDTAAPTAIVTTPPPNIIAATSATSTNTFTITYADSGTGMNPATFGTDDVTVTNGLTTLTVSGVAVSGNAVTYTVQAPNGTWASGAQGVYNVSINVNGVRDIAGNGIAAVSNITSFTVNSFPPTAVLTTPPINVNVANYLTSQIATGINTFTITYNASPLGAPINTGSFNINNVVVSNGAVTLPVTNITAAGNAVTYSVLAPLSLWTALTTQGTFFINIGTNPVRDTAGNPVAMNPNFAYFTVDVFPPVAVAPITTPAPTINTLNSGPGTTTFTICYTDVGLGVDLTKLGVGNVTVSNGAAQATIINAVVAGTPAAPKVTYTAMAPNGNWTSAPQGIWTIGIVPGNVKDLAGNGIVGVPVYSNFIVDTVAPTALLTTPPFTINQANAGLGNDKFTITYADAAPGSMNAGSFGTDDVTVSNGATVLTVTSATAIGNAVTYTVAPPGGNWANVPEGTYAVAINAGSVFDVNGNPVPAVPNLSSFLVDITSPTAVLTPPPPNITATSNPNGTLNVTVVYADTTSGVDPATFGTNDITVNNGATVSSFSAVGNVVTYTIKAQTGNWATSAQGTYTISLTNAGVKDLVGNGDVGVANFGTFFVDAIPPAIVISPPSVLTTNAGPVSWTITYVDANFASSNLTLANIKLNGTPTGTVMLTGSGTSYTLTISNISGQGTLGFSIDPGTAVDILGNLAPAATSPTTNVVGNRNVHLTQPPAPANIAPGSTYIYNIDYNNTGTQLSPNAKIKVTLPANATFVPGSSTAGWVALGGGKYQISLGNIPIGGSGRVAFAVMYAAKTPPGFIATFTATICDDLSAGSPLATSTVSSKIINAARPKWGRC